MDRIHEDMQDMIHSSVSLMLLCNYGAVPAQCLTVHQRQLTFIGLDIATVSLKFPPAISGFLGSYWNVLQYRVVLGLGWTSWHGLAAEILSCPAA